MTQDIELADVDCIEIERTYPNRPDSQATAEVAKAITEDRFKTGIVSYEGEIAYVHVKVETNTDVIEAKLRVDTSTDVETDGFESIQMGDA